MPNTRLQLLERVDRAIEVDPLLNSVYPSLYQRY